MNKDIPSARMIKLGALEAIKICQRKIAVEIDELQVVRTFIDDNSETLPFTLNSRFNLMLIKDQLSDVCADLIKWIEEEESND